jgi:hypothetical protein
MRTSSVLLSACLISILLIASSLARPLFVQRPVVRGISVARSQSPDLHRAYLWPNRRLHRLGWMWRKYDRRIARGWGDQASSWVPAAAGAYGPIYGVGPDAPYSGSAIYYPLDTKKRKFKSGNEDGARHLPKVVYGITPEISATYPSVLFGTMPNQ